eukprot:scaffold202252_cov28-Tisochrysis_lutea.AAC.1
MKFAPSIALAAASTNVARERASELRAFAWALACACCESFLRSARSSCASSSRDVIGAHVPSSLRNPAFIFLFGRDVRAKEGGWLRSGRKRGGVEIERERARERARGRGRAT